MANPDILDQGVRAKIIKDLRSDENNKRKLEHQKRFDIYQNRLLPYVEQVLSEDLDADTVKKMRKVTSINLSKRIVDDLASIYKNPPERTFEGGDEDEIEQMYEDASINSRLRGANNQYKLHDQCALMVVPDPSGESLVVRAIRPNLYDVIPDSSNPEKAFCYVMNVIDLDTHETIKQVTGVQSAYQGQDGVNQSTADPDDRDAVQDRYKFWTDEVFFETDVNGVIISEGGEPLENPVGALPFIDIAGDKDFQFFIRTGQSITQFAVDFCIWSSDLMEVVRLQGYSQPVIKSDKAPQNITVGANNVIWLQLDPNSDGPQPDFQMVTPSPDLEGASSIIDANVKFFLSSMGIDTSSITGRGDGQRFSSGVDRLLAMFDKFEASQGDHDIFSKVEQDLFNLMKLWSGVMPNIKTIPESVTMTTQFAKPIAIKTDQEKEESIQRRLDLGVLSRVEAIAEIRGVSDEEALKIANQIDTEDGVSFGSAESEEDQGQPED